MIQIDDLCFAYEQTEVLHNISLTIDDGSFSVIVGPNGGGKTTLLKLILGLLKPRFGSILIDGISPEKARRLMSYVPQSIRQDPLLPVNVLDTVLMGRLDRNPFSRYTDADRAKARDCLHRVGLEGFDSRPFSDLSGGERQRVLIAQALASEARFLLLDEPGASLDPDHRLQLYELLRQLKSTGDITILLVSHNLNVVSSYASHVICVNRTADCHPIGEVSEHALANGVWTQLHHQGCPVADQEKAASRTPHHACCHH